MAYRVSNRSWIQTGSRSDHGRPAGPILPCCASAFSAVPGALICLAMLVVAILGLPRAVRADDSAAQPAPIVVASPVDARVPPALALDAAGAPHVAWQSLPLDGSPAQIHLSTRPFDASQPLVTVQESPASAALSSMWHALELHADGEVALAWSTGVDGDARASSLIVGQPDSTSWLPGNPDRWTMALNREGELYIAWAVSGRVVVEMPAQGKVWSFDTEPTWTIQSLELTLGSGDAGYVAWALDAAGGGPGVIAYASLSTAGRPVQLSDGGSLEAIAIDDRGALHLVWATADDLWYVNTGNPEGGIEQVAGPFRGEPVALATGPGGIAHLVWGSSGGLWYATSADWALSRALVTDQRPASMAMTIDERNRPYIVWVEQSPEGPARIMLLEPATGISQLAITWPASGGRVRVGDWVQVEANRSPADWKYVTFYVQPTGTSSIDGPLIELATDDEGADGWRVSLVVSGWVTEAPARLVVLGEDREGRIVRAQSDAFALVPAGQATLLLPSGTGAPVSGDVRLEVLVAPGEPELPSQVQVYLTPVREPPTWASEQMAESERLYAGAVPLQRDGGLPFLLLDTRRIPDGTYRISLVADGARGTEFAAGATFDLEIDNTRAPRVAAVVWGENRLQGDVTLSATLDPAYRQARQVDFYLQLAPSGERQGDMPAVGDLLRVGSDTDGSDGWQVAFAPQVHWTGRNWVGWAVACDERELCGSGAAPAQLLRGRDTPALWLDLTEGAVLAGRATLRMRGDVATDQVLRAEAFIENAKGSLQRLGSLRRDGPGWLLGWNTEAVRDGAYSLVVEVRLGSGARIRLRVEQVTIANQPGGWRLEDLPAVASGIVPLRVAHDDARIMPQRTLFYLVDASEKVIPIEDDAGADSGGTVLWNTHAVVDGAYRLVAAITVDGQDQVSIEHDVLVQNNTLELAFLRVPGNEPVTGRQPIAWTGSATEGGDVSVSLAYSPDAGGTWIPLAEGLGGSGSWLWDSTTVPDSQSALLRIVASDGLRHAQVSHGPFMVDNNNAAPAVSLLWPTSGAVLGRTATIGWHAQDPEGADVSVDLLFRSSDGSWRPLAAGLPATGQYEWDTLGLGDGQSYALRALARDNRNASGMDTVADVTIIDNRPPEVDLIWPDENVVLYSGAALLWQTTDPDGDPLVIDLYYSDNDGLSWYLLAEDVIDAGYYVWEVNFLPPGGAYRLRLVARDAHARGYDESTGAMTVVGEGLPAVHLTSPEAGAAVRGVWPLEWQAAYPARGSVFHDLLIRAAEDSEWGTLAEGLRNVSHYLWDTSRHADGRYDLAVRLRRGDERVVSNVVTQVTVRNVPSAAPEVRVLAPTGGEVLSEYAEIRWQAAAPDPAASAYIEVSADAGAQWSLLETLPASRGRYLWDTRAWPAGNAYLVRVTVADGVGQAQAASPGAFTLAGAGLRPPRVSLSVHASGGTRPARVAWTVEDTVGDAVSVALEVCDTLGRDCRPAGEALPATGDLAVELVAGRDYRVGVLVDDGLHQVASFVIWAQPEPDATALALAVLAPRAGTEWMGSVLITWQASAADEDPILVDIAYSADGGSHWQTIIDGLENVGRYLWQTTLLPNGTYHVRVTVQSGSSRLARYSGAFELSTSGRYAPFVSLTGDPEAVGLLGGRAVMWRATDRDNDALTITLQYSHGPQGPWMALVDESRSAGSAGWSGSALPNGNNLWLRLVASDGRFRSESVPMGPIVVDIRGAPRVRLVSPVGGQVWTGPQAVAWRSTYDGGVSVTLQESVNAGVSWQDIVAGLPATGSFAWNADAVAGQGPVLLRAVAEGGARVGVAELLQPVYVSVPGQAPALAPPAESPDR